MSDFTQAVLIGGSISGMVIATQYGRRKLELRGILRSVVLVAGCVAHLPTAAGTAHVRGLTASRDLQRTPAACSRGTWRDGCWGRARA